jgi:hypothetical protein
MSDRSQYLEQLKELYREHRGTLYGGPGEAPGFIEDEQVTRHSYGMVVEEALSHGVLTKDDLAAEDLPIRLDLAE